MKMPICPYCKTEMYIFDLEASYYDYTIWKCKCTERDLKEKNETT